MKKCCLSVLVICVLLLSACAGNGQEKEPYEMFSWGSGQEEVAQKLSSLEINIDNYIDENCIQYRDEHIFGLADALITYRFGDNDSLNEVSVMMALDEDEAVESLIDTLKKKYGTPQEESDKTILGIRELEMNWVLDDTEISLGGSVESFLFLTLTAAK